MSSQQSARLAEFQPNQLDYHTVKEKGTYTGKHVSGWLDEVICAVCVNTNR